MRFTKSVRRVAAIAAGAMIAGATLAGPAPVAHALDGITQANLSGAQVVLPTDASADTGLTLTFTAPQDPTVSYVATATVSLVKSPIKKSKVKKPTVTVPTTLTPGTSNTVTVKTSPATSRGDYKVTVKITQMVSGVAAATSVVSAKIRAYHSAENSKALTTVTHVGYYKLPRSKLRIKATLPRYQAGSKYTISYTTNGLTYKRLASGRVGKSGGITVKSKTIRVPSIFGIRLSVKGVAYAPGYLHDSYWRLK